MNLNFRSHAYLAIASICFVCCEKESEPLPVSESDSAKDYSDNEAALRHLLRSIKFERFDADGKRLNDALQTIEDRINESWSFGKDDLLVTTSSGGVYNPELTIVLANVSVETLLDIISDQTGLSYRIDPLRPEIYFYSTHDIIDFDDDESDNVEPVILPLPDGELPD